MIGLLVLCREHSVYYILVMVVGLALVAVVGVAVVAVVGVAVVAVVGVAVVAVVGVAALFHCRCCDANSARVHVASYIFRGQFL